MQSKQVSLLCGSLLVFALGLVGCQSPTTTTESPQPSVSASVGTPSPTVSGSVQPGTATFAAAKDTETCMKCHGEGTDLNNKIQNAREGWKVSNHALGVIEENMGEGTDAFYANGGGCQVCHTKEGFLKKVNGQYADQKAIDADFISTPSSITCFTCHKPHTTADFTLTYPANKSVTLISGAVYDKAEGSICASCHMARTNGTGAQYALTSVKGTATSTAAVLSGTWGPHHGPQADMLLGKAGAEYAGKTYSNGAHTSLSNANCVSCHMPFPSARFGFSPRVAGHSFNVVGEVHGSPVANTAGCVTCHSTIKTGKVGATGALPAKGHLQKDDAYFILGKDKEHAQKMSEILDVLANPDSNCNGLLQKTFEDATVAGTGKKISWSTDGLCMPTAYPFTKDDAAADTSPKVRFAKALYNYKFILEDKSFGIHNNKYSLQLMVDTCEDLKDLTKSADLFCGVRP